ncbi:DUF6950 family protein [Parasedimentitalea psychrophila]|uniref:DUF6950 domain-containing protein n=1 Tax=Parasedimentitalea psychrophila TaxID=2997337 RepID=A0A9Y2P0P5_9RHOB|nr:hypothetical protein [Parasedimentitalea psychrophila]WIY23357.1 hypothetical protein QPJ95_11840 [Parasedimentitalea psychrophila]
MTPLYQELHRWAAKPFIWGETDCMLCLADWVLRVTGRDPAAAVRGVYDSRGSCQRETGFLRDPVMAVEACLATIGGLPRVDTPQPGDMAVLMVRDPDGRCSPCGALWLGSAWGCKGPQGATTLSPQAVCDVLAIWGVGYEA